MEAAPENTDGFGVVQLRAAGVGVVLDCQGPGLPEVLHWGADLGELSAAQLETIALASAPLLRATSFGMPRRVSLLPEHANGWAGLPGLRG
ncbi:MAG TPA: hypothetical protein VIQ02_19160, partial [Jiangellaceae bacterium]